MLAGAIAPTWRLITCIQEELRDPYTYRFFGTPPSGASGGRKSGDTPETPPRAAPLDPTLADPAWSASVERGLEDIPKLQLGAAPLDLAWSASVERGLGDIPKLQPGIAPLDPVSKTSSPAK